MGEFLMGVVLAGLSMTAIAIMIMGLGILSRTIFTTVAGRVSGKEASQIRNESDENPEHLSGGL